MERSNFSLRVLPSLLHSLQRIAEQEHCSVNQLINVAIAEKVAVLEAPRFAEIKRRAAEDQSARSALDLLQWKAGNEQPREGDEAPRTARRSSVLTPAHKH